MSGFQADLVAAGWAALFFALTAIGWHASAKKGTR